MQIWALLVVVLGLLGWSYWLAHLLLYGRRQPVTRSPACYGLAYEDVSFASQHGLRLQGWWIPAAPTSNRAVILLHPFLGNRQGSGTTGHYAAYPPAVDLLRLAQRFHAAGYAVMLFDFRSHGESQRGLCAAGLTEAQDVVGAVEYTFQRLAEETPQKPAMVGLVGFGTGASAALVAVGRERGSAEVIRFFSGDSEGGSGFVEYQPPKVKQLCFLVAVEPVSPRIAVKQLLHPWLVPLAALLTPLVSWWCWQRGGYPLNIDYLSRYVAEIHVPVFYIGDREANQLQHLYAATPAPKELYLIDTHPPRHDGYCSLCDNLAPIFSFIACCTATEPGAS